MLLQIVLVIILIFFVLKLNKKQKGLPPGEWGLPIVGFLPFMNWRVTKTLKTLEQKHGRIFTVKLGSVIFIVMCDYSLIKEAFKKEEFSGKPEFYGNKTSRKNLNQGILFNQRHNWFINRRFAMKAFNEFGFGKSTLEENILTEVKTLVQDLKSKVNKPYIIDWNLNVAILNIIWKIVANQRYEIDDIEIKVLTQNMSDIIKLVNGPMALLNIFPQLIPYVPKFLMNSWMKESDLICKRDKLFKYFSNIIEDHKTTFDPKKPRDYIDAYLIEQEQQKGNPGYSHFGNEDLIVTLMDIFVASSETTASSLRWFFLYLAKYQDVQKRVQQEIDRVLPNDKMPSLNDKPNLPTLEALNCELLRIVSVAPLAGQHSVTKDTTLNGYFIPKGSVAIVHSEFCHRDPKFWKHPNKFSLENFLDNEGRFVSPKEGFLPFSIGRRQCLGEQLAKNELFLFMGSILQNFNVTEPEGQSVTLEPDRNVFQFNFPPKFKIVLQKRF